MILAAILVLIILFGLFFTGKSGVEAAEQAATDDDPVRRAVYQGQSSCMGVLFAVIGAAGVFVLLGLIIPGS